MLMEIHKESLAGHSKSMPQHSTTQHLSYRITQRYLSPWPDIGKCTTARP